jgi:hypothetical protein
MDEIGLGVLALAAFVLLIIVWAIMSSKEPYEYPAPAKWRRRS